MKLTKPQLRELKRITIEPRGTYGSATARVQNTLKRLGLVEFGFVAYRGMQCSITEAGRAHLVEISERNRG